LAAFLATLLAAFLGFAFDFFDAAFLTFFAIAWISLNYSKS
jgi:hypothetical protein